MFSEVSALNENNVAANSLVVILSPSYLLLTKKKFGIVDLEYIFKLPLN
jgi:hypothetical protein